MTVKNNTLYNKIYDIYDQWIQGDVSSSSLITFYNKIISKLDKNIEIVELGIGTGRVSIHIAKNQNRQIIGIDNSLKMLKKCKENIIKNNVEDKIKLIQMDIKELKLPKKANFIMLPYGTIGHFLTTKEKNTIFQKIYNNLEVGGIFIIDHYILDESLAKKQNDTYIKMYSEKNLTIYNKSIFDFNKQTLNCTIYEEKTNTSPILKASFEYSWIEPFEMEKILLDVGFRVKNNYGSFEFDALDFASKRQIWVVEKYMV